MAQFAPHGWALSDYEDLSDWSLELANIKSSALEKLCTTLLNMAEMMHELGAPLEAEELVVEEVASSVGTHSKCYNFSHVLYFSLTLFFFFLSTASL